MSDLQWPKVRVGAADQETEAAGADADPDDEELAATPADVILALGFDPLDENRREAYETLVGGAA